MATNISELNLSNVREEDNFIEDVYCVDFLRDKNVINKDKFPLLYKFYDKISDSLKLAIFEYNKAVKYGAEYIDVNIDELWAELSGEDVCEVYMTNEEKRALIKELGF